jgi:hypothetical protein
VSTEGAGADGVRNPGKTDRPGHPAGAAAFCERQALPCERPLRCRTIPGASVEGEPVGNLTRDHIVGNITLRHDCLCRHPERSRS